jgi:hypothetical protein
MGIPAQTVLFAPATFEKCLCTSLDDGNTLSVGIGLHGSIQDAAANNLKIKMTALETANASESTALALAKATENIAATNTATIDTNLRLLNLEKALKRQEQRTNEITNTNRKVKAQKILSGSQTSEPLASPVKQALKQQKRRIVDLTQSDSNDAEIWKPQGTPKTKT